MATPAMSWEQYQAQQAEIRKRLQGLGGKGGKHEEPAWKKRMNNFNPKDTKTWIRLYPDWYLYYGRWCGEKPKKFVISNSHNGEKDVPDLLFLQADRANNPKLLASRYLAATVTVLEYYHEVEVPNKDPKKSKGYINYERCDGTDIYGRSRCKLCASGAKKVFGQRKHWSMSPRSKDDLEEEMSLRLKMCLNCCKGEVSASRFSCNKCSKVILDRYQEEVSDEDANQLHDPAGIECPHCGQACNPVCVYECFVPTGGGYAKGCDKPIPVPYGAGIYDLEYLVEQDSSDWTISINAFRLAGEHPELPGHMLQPMDFHSFFSHMTLEDQAKALGCDNPFGAEGEAIVANFFARQPGVAQASKAGPEEADPHSITWNKK